MTDIIRERLAAVAFSTGLQAVALTDVGMRRTTNQDSHALSVADTLDAYLSRGHLLVVADGMGAHAAGELASKIATEGIPHLYHHHREISAPEALLRAIRETNTEIHRRGTANPDFHNMGTTLSALALLPQGAIAAHVGDSRIYRLRGSTLHQLTFDHSLQWELQASGQLPPGTDIASMVPKNVITRSLGPNQTVQIDLEGPHPIAVGDVFLLCSDGLTGKVDDAELGAILAAVPPPEAARALVDLANLRGGPDNITVLIAKVAGAEAATGGVQAPTLRIGSSQEKRPVHPMVWVAAVACALAAGLMALMKLWIVAGVALVGGIVAVIVGLTQRYQGYKAGTELGGGHMLGKGPFITVECPPSHALVQRLAGTLEELREAARDGEWRINWGPLDEACKAAAAADAGTQFAEAIRHYCRGISYMMNELRRQNVRKAGNSVLPN